MPKSRMLNSPIPNWTECPKEEFLKDKCNIIYNVYPCPMFISFFTDVLVHALRTSPHVQQYMDIHHVCSQCKYIQEIGIQSNSALIISAFSLIRHSRFRHSGFRHWVQFGIQSRAWFRNSAFSPIRGSWFRHSEFGIQEFGIMSFGTESVNRKKNPQIIFLKQKPVVLPWLLRCWLNSGNLSGQP